MRELRIGVLGATGAVGREMLHILEEYRVPVLELRLLSGPKSAGSKIVFAGKALPVSCADEGCFTGLDYVLGASEPAVSRRFAPAIRAAGAVFIDNSSAFRLDPAVKDFYAFTRDSFTMENYEYSAFTGKIPVAV